LNGLELVFLQTGPVMEQAVRGLVLVPTKELARQAQAMIQQLAAYCARDVRVANVSAAEDSASQRWVKPAGLQRENALQVCALGGVSG
jgi:superfamily II DNA/RNA helicase